jgi:superfamily II DNA/RNA helicase
MMQKLKEDEEKGVETIAGRPRGIIILPNRELAQQVLVSTMQLHVKYQYIDHVRNIYGLTRVKQFFTVTFTCNQLFPPLLY